MHTDFQAPKSHELITLRPADDAWGPYEYDVAPALPDGVTLQSVSATAHRRGSDGTWTEAPELVEPDSETVTGDATLQLKLQGTDEEGSALQAGDYYLSLTLSLSNGGTKELVFGPIILEAFG